MKPISLRFGFAAICITVSAFMMSCNTAGNIIKKDLSQSPWEFSEKGKNLPLVANVPGCVHTDLLKNRKIPDPYFRNNEKDLQWIGEKDWVYKTEFSVSEQLFSKENIELKFKGLDTFATVFLNDSLILEADNFFREWTVNVKPCLKKTGNTLKVAFSSAAGICRQKQSASAIPLRDEYAYARKPAYHFGWDWGPVFITAGIWKPVILEAWDTARINDMQIIQTRLSKQEAAVTCIYTIEADRETEAEIITRCLTNNTETAKTIVLKKGINTVASELIIKNPSLWWSHGLGDAFLYEFEGTVRTGKKTVDCISAKTGLRTIRLVQKPDSLGKSFYFELNGVPVFMKGANYIPQDMFLNRPAEKDYSKIIKNTLAANMNMLRVWGGGFYENDIFYDLCDENGILVWQDFMFACAMYPGDAHFLENVRNEAVQTVKRLRNHPCIALWCGNNENYIGWKDWRWSNHLSKQDSARVWQDYLTLYHNLLPDVIQTHDPDRYYWPSSPLYGWGYPVNTDGDVHYWGIWHAQEPFENFQKKEFIGRFMSEYGFQGCPEMSSVKKFTIPDDHDIYSEVMLGHQKHRIGYPVIDKYFTWYYHTPKDFEAYLYVSQVQQAFGIGMAIEAHRRAMPHCMGTLYWQINDCYPVTSWSSIDCYGKWKALHYKARETYKTVLVSPYVQNGLLNIYVVSDSLSDFNAAVDIKLCDFKGAVIKKFHIDTLIHANTSRIYFQTNVKNFLSGLSPANHMLRTEVTAASKVLASNDFYFVNPKDLELPDPHIRMTSKKTSTGYALTLTSDVFAKDVFLSTPNGQGHFTQNFFDIIPGIPVNSQILIKDTAFNPDTDIQIYSLKNSYE